MTGSRLGLLLGDGDMIPSGTAEHLRTVMNTVKEEYTVAYAEGSRFEDHYRYALVTLRESLGKGRTFELHIRAYDEGVAFRYVVPDQEGVGRTTIMGEATTFSFNDDLPCFAEYGTEGEYSRVQISRVRQQCEVPLAVELPDGRYVSIGEAALLDHSRMLLKNAGNGSTSLQVQLCSRVVRNPGFETPWRVVIAGNGSGDLIENSHILYSLCPESKLKDISWIRPGKAFRDCTLTTNGSKAVIDFCSENGLQYVHLDAGWYGKEFDPGSDASSASVPDLDIPEIVRYGKDKGIGVVLYVNNRSLRKQLDKVLPLYQEWGIKGIKFGFMDGRTQTGINFIHYAVQKAAEHELFVIIHDNYRPTGLTRTYPNILSVEGVRGNEHFPTPYHNTLLPYTRSVCGPMDYTPRAVPYKERTTSCHQMALPFVFFSPMTFLYWYQDPIAVARSGPFEAWRDLPTVWDEVIYPDDIPGRYASALKRNGDTWFYGFINGPSPARAVVDLAPVGEGRTFAATIFKDDHGSIDTRRYLVDRNTIIDEQVVEDGGSCAMIRPATLNDLRTLSGYPSWSKTCTELTVEEDKEMMLFLCMPGSNRCNLTYDAWTDSDFISFDPMTGTVSGTPGNDDIGRYHFSVLIRYDGEPIGSLMFTINVLNTNDPPMITELPRYIEVMPGEELLVEPRAEDVDPTSDRLIWDIAGDVSFVSIDPLTGILRGTPTRDDIGTHLIEVSVDDGNGGTCTREMIFHVNDTSIQEKVTTLDRVIFLCEDVPFEIDLREELMPEWEAHEGLIIEKMPGFVSIFGDGPIFRGIPTQSDIGVHEILIRMKTEGEPDEIVQFRMIVIGTNDPPVFVNSSIFLMTAVGEHIDLEFVVDDEDDAREVLTWSLWPCDDFLALDMKAGTLQGTPLSDDKGVHRMVLKVTDPGGGVAEMEVTLLVLAEGSLLSIFDDRPILKPNIGSNATGVSCIPLTMVRVRIGSGEVVAVPMTDGIERLLSGNGTSPGVIDDRPVIEEKSDAWELILPLFVISLTICLLMVLVLNHSGKARSKKG